MTVDKDGNEFTCSAGREADFGGKWLLPCHIPYSENAHVLITALGRWRFCEPHMQELIDAGLITDPYVDEEVAVKLAQYERDTGQSRTVGRPLFGPWNEP